MTNHKGKKGFWKRFFRKEYDFFGGLACHAAKVSEGMNALVEWAKTGDPALAIRVREIEHEADQIQLKIEQELGEVFATPIDREDIHQIAGSIDQIMNYAKNAVREMEIFNLSFDDDMVKIIALLQDGACAIYESICLLPTHSPEIVHHIERAVKCERIVEKFYRQGVNNLFEIDDIKAILKRREVYRHLSNTADRIHEAANLLSMIHVKYD